MIIRESEEHVEKARDFFQRAVELDPEYAQAWAQLSIAESELYFAGARPRPDWNGPGMRLRQPCGCNRN